MTNPYGQMLTALLERGRRRTPTTPPPAAAPAAPSLSDLASNMTCTRTDSGSACLLQIEGALHVHSAPDLRVVFDAVVAAHPELVTLDLAGLTMLDSSGVGAIVSLFKRVRDGGGRVIVKGVQGQPLAVCKLLKLDRVFGF